MAKNISGWDDDSDRRHGNLSRYLILVYITIFFIIISSISYCRCLCIYIYIVQYFQCDPLTVGLSPFHELDSSKSSPLSNETPPLTQTETCKVWKELLTRTSCRLGFQPAGETTSLGKSGGGRRLEGRLRRGHGSCLATAGMSG